MKASLSMTVKCDAMHNESNKIDNPSSCQHKIKMPLAIVTVPVHGTKTGSGRDNRTICNEYIVTFIITQDKSSLSCEEGK